MRSIISLFLIITLFLPAFVLADFDDIVETETFLEKIKSIPEILKENLKFLYKTAKTNLSNWFWQKKEEVQQDIEHKIDEEIDKTAENLKTGAKNKFREGTSQGRGIIKDLWEKIF